MQSRRVIHSVCHMLNMFMSTCNVCFHALVPTFYFILCSRSGFPIRCVICSIFSSLQWMCSFLPWVPRFILSFAVGTRPHPCVICFILSYPTVTYSLIPCNLFSDCSVHPLIWSVLSTIRTKCTITNCLKSAFTQSL